MRFRTGVAVGKINHYAMRTREENPYSCFEQMATGFVATFRVTVVMFYLIHQLS